MASRERAIAILPADDLRTAKKFYVDALGFGVRFEVSSNEKEGLLGLQRGSIELTVDSPMAGHGRNVCVSLQVDDVDRYYAEWSAKVEGIAKPKNEGWGARTFGLQDPFGNTLFVMGPVKAAKSAAIPWFERQFTFDFSPDELPKIKARLESGPGRLEAAIEGVSDKVLTRRSGETWSAQEHAGHLVDLEALWIARVNDYLQRRDYLTPADLTNQKTFDAQHNKASIRDIVREFHEVRRRLLQMVEDVDPTTATRTLPHPRMKTPMRLVDHLYFVAEHDDHHLGRIRELLSGE
jgi:uncharacterized damage-inducible protein DinB/uncharacterized glyoxalase superfamily protein PhnB